MNYFLLKGNNEKLYVQSALTYESLIISGKTQTVLCKGSREFLQDLANSFNYNFQY